MFCKYCGTKLIDDAAFCHECGKATCEQSVQPVIAQSIPPVQPVPPVPPVYQQPAAPVQPVYQPPVFQQPIPPQYTYTVPSPPVQPAPQPTAETVKLEQLAQQTLTMGILGLSLSMLGVPGIIFSSIAGKKANDLQKLTGTLTGKALVGYRLAKAGKIVSIVMTVLLSIVLSKLLEGDITYEYTDPFEYYDF